MVNQSESCTTKTVSNNKRKRASKAQENQIGQESGPTNFNNQELQHPNNEQIADVTKSQNDKVKIDLDEIAGNNHRKQTASPRHMNRLQSEPVHEEMNPIEEFIGKIAPREEDGELSFGKRDKSGRRSAVSRK